MTELFHFKTTLSKILTHLLHLFISSKFVAMLAGMKFKLLSIKCLFASIKERAR